MAPPAAMETIATVIAVPAGPIPHRIWIRTACPASPYPIPAASTQVVVAIVPSIAGAWSYTDRSVNWRRRRTRCHPQSDMAAPCPQTGSEQNRRC